MHRNKYFTLTSETLARSWEEKNKTLNLEKLITKLNNNKFLKVLFD